MNINISRLNLENEHLRLRIKAFKRIVEMEKAACESMKMACDGLMTENALLKYKIEKILSEMRSSHTFISEQLKNTGEKQRKLMHENMEMEKQIKRYKEREKVQKVRGK